ncbi:MAG: hypothetical protein AAGD38_15220 [Acidobacteriota bacterium]
MILANLGIINISNDKEALFSETDVSYQVTSADGESLIGDLAPSAYRQVTPPGKGPWTVKMGLNHFSYSSTTDGIESADAMISNITIYPVPPNGSHNFVDDKS